MQKTAITLKNPALPGIIGLLNYDQQTGQVLSQLVETLLRRPESTLTIAEREILASYVSIENGCTFCSSSHGAAAAVNAGVDVVDYINNLRDFKIDPSLLSNKMRKLLVIASSVRKGGNHVTSEEIEAAKNEGATDAEIHDTVLIAAAFCMFNRYVDGLGTQCPTDPSAYVTTGQLLATKGYMLDLNFNK